MNPFELDRDAVMWAGLRALDSVAVRCSMVEEHQIFPNAIFPWTEHLEAEWRTIRAEADEVLRDRRSIPPVRELSPDHRKIAVDDRWRSFFLWGYGLRWQSNCERCPETSRLLEGVPDLLSAFFSVLLPGTHIPRHTGPTKTILTAHLGLRVPPNRQACHMRIGDHDIAWEEGRLLIFDDMYPHEVWNDAKEDRIVLLLHIKRPQRFPGSLMSDGFFAALRRSHMVQDGLRNLDNWERSLRARAASL